MKRVGATLIATALLLAVLPAMSAVGQPQNFVAPLSGDEEVPAVDTQARGQTKFQLSRDGTELHYRLIAANIENINQAHIHCGAAGVNGPVIAWLYPTDVQEPIQIPGRFDGVLAVDTLTAADVVPQPDSAACPGGVADFDDLMDKITSGLAYVNVHTNPGFPAGEIRGQIR